LFKSLVNSKGELVKIIFSSQLRERYLDRLK
jgi:hypothetical protein